MDPRHGPDRLRDESWVGKFDETNMALWEDVTSRSYFLADTKQ